MGGVGELTPGLVAGVTLVTLIGATLQGTVGFGMGMFVVPVLLLVNPAFVPGPTLATMGTLTLAMTFREWRAVRVGDLKWAIAGRLVGIGVALAVLTLVPAGALGPVLGGLVLAAVALTASGWHVRPSARALAVAGSVSGFMGTSVSIGGPPMALLYQHESGPEVRATLSAYFVIGIGLSLAGLHAVGRFGLGELRLVAVLLPGTVLGFLASHRLAPLLDRGYTRRAILGLAALMGLAVVGKYALAGGSAPLTVVTYNIRHGRGMDDRVDLERTAAVLRRLDPDIVGLQEVDRGAMRSGGVDQADSLGALLGLDHAFGAFMPYEGGEYGMAILSRFPIRGVEALPLPPGNEPRTALAAEVAVPGADPVTVVNVHFDWVDDDGFRYAQAASLAAWLRDRPGAVILLGDFNDVPGSRTLALFGGLRAAGKPVADRFTFSSRAPAREIDHVYAGPAAAWNVLEVRVVDEPAASDHRPVLVRLRRR